ncbi:Outer membrane protein assembly factor BamB precursor [Rosistilla carotiformis]|uniref:Outer membrane protein assembly factor BamB n=1 Tax=Rosistilla carotiformis TaxID=2528017 RepID=A0A518JNY2_9BACT|nr:PQQ-binding-like beta-propeller repeat protein [Rosistilla carotiformis]QDV67243.1 Outer membrane protein assembly factor BamB precursor [Rosistilla carotiformis]
MPLPKLALLLCTQLALWASVSICPAQWPVERGDQAATGAVPTPLPENLAVAWDFADAKAFEATPVIDAGRVYAADTEGGVYCLNLADGTLVWKVSIDTGFLAAPAIQGETLILGDYDGMVYALSTVDGSERWKFEAEGQIDSGAMFHGEKVLITSEAGKLHALKLSDGSVVWEYETADQIRCSATVAGDRTFLGGCDSQLHVVDLNTGKKATDPMPLESPTNSTPAVVGPLAFLPTYGGQVFAFDWQKGIRTWTYEDPEKSQEYRSSAAATDKVVVVSSQGKRVTGLDATTGKQLWQTMIRRRADSSPVIAGDSVLLAATDGRLYRLNLQDGKPTWQYEVKGALLASPAIADGKLILTTEEGHILCFGGK